MEKKAQTAYEFLMVMFMLSIGFVFWISFASSFQEDLQLKKNIASLEDFSLSLKHDLFVLAQMPDKFTRSLNIPLTINGIKYDLKNDNYDALNFTTIFIENKEIGFYTHFDVPLLNGTLRKGDNNLTKNSDKIEIGI